MNTYDDVTPLILSVDESAEVSIKDVVHMIVNAMGFQGQVQFDTSKSDGQFKKTASNAKLMSLLDKPFEFVPMKDGIGMTVKWFVDNFEIARK